MNDKFTPFAAKSSSGGILPLHKTSALEIASLNQGSDNPLYDDSLKSELRLERAEDWYKAQLQKLSAKLETLTAPAEQVEVADQIQLLSEELEVLSARGFRILDEISIVSKLLSTDRHPDIDQIVQAMESRGGVKWPPARRQLEAASAMPNAIGEAAVRLLYNVNNIVDQAFESLNDDAIQEIDEAIIDRIARDIAADPKNFGELPERAQEQVMREFNVSLKGSDDKKS